MEFIVRRTSIWNNARPCYEAVPKTISYKYMGEAREENVWVVEFSNLKELMKFRNKYGSVIIGRREYGVRDNELVVYDSIEIYDGYRE